MAYLRFFHRFRVAPGLTFNLSKGGASISAGERGAHVTVGTSGERETVGLPGTGLSVTEVQGRRRGRSGGVSLAAVVVMTVLVVLGMMILG